jgi:hypothetical protein
MAIDWSKPIETECGFPARVVCTDRNDVCYPVIVLYSVCGCEGVLHMGLDGHTEQKHGGASLSIRNVPEKGVRYVNVYGNGPSVAWMSRDVADKNAEYNQLTRIACVRVEYTEGQFDA